jgi:predicted AlkP superfamily pyrophosphatase or phosphodiesterase
MKPVIFILADAFRYDYIKKHDLKFLTKHIEKSEVNVAKELFPSTGYCEIIEYFTGQESDEHGMFSQITAVENWREIKSPSFFKYFESIDLKLASIRKVRYVWAKLLSKVLPKFVDPSVANIKYKVPLSILNRFTPTESLYEYDSFDFGGDKNVFVNMRDAGITYDLDDFVKHNKIQGTDKDRFERLREKIKSDKLQQFTMIYVSAPEYAHFFGVDGDVTKQKLNDFDSELERLDSELSNAYDDYDLIIVGDHGMLDVNESVDIESEIKEISKENNLTLGLDYLYFIDSTVCRLWYKNDHIKGLFEPRLEAKFADKFELEDSVLSYLQQFKPKYGDSLYMLKANKVYFPDFFNGSPNKGMHGYLNHYPGQQGCVIWKGNKSLALQEKVKLADVKDIIWKSVNE